MIRKGLKYQHPGQEDKSGKAIYASTTRVNSSTVQSIAEHLTPDGPESEFKRNLSRARGVKHALPKTSK